MRTRIRNFAKRVDKIHMRLSYPHGFNQKMSVAKSCWAHEKNLVTFFSVYSCLEDVNKVAKQKYISININIFAIEKGTSNQNSRIWTIKYPERRVKNCVFFYRLRVDPVYFYSVGLFSLRLDPDEIPSTRFTTLYFFTYFT